MNRQFVDARSPIRTSPLAAALTLAAASLAAQGQLVADLNRALATPNSSQPREFVEFDGDVWFAATAPFVGRELWRTGIGGTRLARDVALGTFSSAPSNLTVFGSQLAFVATNGLNQRIPIAMDATSRQPVILSSTASDPTDLIVAGGRLFFFATSAGFGRELWVSRGNHVDAVRISDMAPGNASATPARIVPFGNGIAMIVDDTIHGYELWVSDGTAAGTRLVRDLAPGAASGAGNARPVALGNELLFNGTDGTLGNELYATDGTNVRLVADIVLGAVGSFPNEMIGFDNRIAFAAGSGNQRALFATDGTAAGTLSITSLVDPRRLTVLADGRLAAQVFTGSRIDIAFVAPGTLATNTLGLDLPATNDPGLITAGTRLYFAGGSGLFVSNGSAAGTTLLPIISTGPILGRADGSAVVAASTAAHGVEPWYTDGTPAGTRLLADVDPRRPTGDSTPTFIDAIAGRGLAIAITTNARELVASDGTPAGTTGLAAVTGQPGAMAKLNDCVLIADRFGGMPLLRTDGTPAGTFMLGTLRADAPAPDLAAGELDGGRAVFVASPNSQTTSSQLYITDGTLAGTQLLSDLRPGGRASAFGFARLGSAVCFLATTPDPTLWRTDGTAAGTTRVRTFRTAPGGQNPHMLGVAGGRAIFYADDGVHGTELWATDGTSAGTQLLLDFSSTGGTAFLTQRGVVVGNRLLVNNLQAIISTDGTPAGTFVLPGFPGSTPTFGGGNFAMLARVATSGTELVRTDGTLAGTVALPIALPYGVISATTISDERLALILTTTLDAVLLVTDGTLAGTSAVTSNAALNRLLAVDGKVLYPGRGEATGIELWSYDVGATALATGLGCSAVADGVRLGIDAPRLGTTITARVTSPNAAHALLLGAHPLAPVRLPGPVSGCALFVDSASLVTLPMSSLGRLTLSVPGQTSLLGTRLAAQAISGPAAGQDIDWSNGVRLTLGQ